MPATVSKKGQKGEKAVNVMKNKKELVKKNINNNKKRQEVVEESDSDMEEYEQNEMDSGSDVMDEDMEDLHEAEFEEEMEEMEGDNDEESEETSQHKSKKPKTDFSVANLNTAVASNRAEQKELQLQRKLQRPNGEIIIKAKKLWEKLRVRVLPDEKRPKLMDEMMDLITGRVHDIIFKHDASRVIQTCIKYGNEDQRTTIATELKGSYVELSNSQYGKFIVVKILKYLPKLRKDIIKEFYGKVTKMIRHKDAAVVVETAYSEYATATERTALVEEFYGPEFVVFKSTTNRSIHELLTTMPAKKESILKHMSQSLTHLLEKASTNITSQTIVHRVLNEYLQYAAKKDIDNMVALLKDHVIHILHTREGSLVGRAVLLHSQAKDRKYIMKTFKSFMIKIAKEQHGHQVLITLFDCVDDTTLVGKIIIKELTSDLDALFELARHKYASRVLLFLLAPVNRRRYFPLSLLKELEASEPIRALTSKKDTEVRAKELRECVVQPLLETMTNNANEALRCKEASQVLFETIQLATEDSFTDSKTKLFQQMASLLTTSLKDLTTKPESSKPTTPAEPFHAVKKLAAEAAAEKEANPSALFAETGLEPLDLTTHLMLHRTANQTLKHLIKSNSILATSVLEALSKPFENISSGLLYWMKYAAENPTMTSGVAFVIVGLLESGVEEVVSGVKKILNAKEVKELKTLVTKKLKEAEKTNVVKESNGKDKKRKRDQKDETKKPSGPRQTGVEIALKALE